MCQGQLQLGTTFRNPKFIFLVLLIVGMIGLFDPPIDPDFGWHYKYGEYAVQNGQLLTTNIFTYTLTEYQWVNSYWLFQIILYLTHSTLGHMLATGLLAILLSAVYLWYLSKQTKDTKVMSLLFILGTFLFAQLHVAVRPHLFSTIFMLVLLHVLDTGKFKKILPVMFLAWANIHAEFVIGLFIFGVFTLLDIVGNLKRSGLKQALNENFIVFTLSCIATLINPHGVMLWLTMFKEMVQPINSLVGEWESPLRKTMNELVRYSVYLAFAGLAIVYTPRVDWANKKLWKFLLSIMFFLFALKSVYMLRIAFIFSLSYLAKFLATHKTLRQGGLILTSTILILGLTILLKGFTYIGVSKTTETWSNGFGLPFEEVAQLKNKTITGNIFNYYGWGGYLIWQMPEHKIFIDGRMTGWKEDNEYFTKKYKLIRDYPYENSEMVSSTFDQYDIKYVLDEPNSRLVAFLVDKGWNIVQKSDRTILLQKN